MKKRQKRTIVILLLLLLFVIWSIRSNSGTVWKEKVLLYLENQYEGQFEVVDIEKGWDEYNISLKTEDSNQILFHVRCWTGGLLTPWGELANIPERHYLDDFPEQITNKFVDSTITYDLSSKSLEEAITYLKSLLINVQDWYDLYGLSWQRPEIKITIKYNGKTEEVEYSSQDDNRLRELLVSKFFLN